MSDERETALLTPAQRKYLRGNSDIEKKSSHERAVRARIRNRVRNSVFDLALLHNTIEDRDLKKAFTDDNSGKTLGDWLHVLNHVSDSLALVFDGTALTSKYDYTATGEPPSDEILAMLSDFIEPALESVYVKRGENVKQVDVDIDIEFGDSLSNISNEKLTSLSEETLHQLVQSGEISREQWIKALHDLYEDSDIFLMDTADKTEVVRVEDGEIKVQDVGPDRRTSDEE
jgi:hypothetical protein